MGKQTSLKTRTSLCVVSALLARVNAAVTDSEPAACSGCVLEAGFGIVSYTKKVETVVIATETIQPYVYTYKDGSAITTQKRIYSPAPTGKGPEPKELTWEIPGLEGYTLTFPTTYAIVTSIGGGIKSDHHQKRDGSPSSCETKASKVNIPGPVAYDSLVFEVTDTGYEAAPTIPPAVLDYLNGVPHVRSQFDGQVLASCQRIVTAAPGTTVPSFGDPPRLKARGRYQHFVRQATSDTDSDSSTTTDSSSSTSSAASSPSSTSPSSTIQPSILPTQAPETLTTITQLTSTTLPTITASASPERPQSAVDSTTSSSTSESESESTTSTETAETSQTSESSTSTSTTPTSEPQISIELTSSAIIIDSTATLSAGTDTTISGVPISVPSKASSSEVVIDNTSVPLPYSSLIVVPSATTTLPPLNTSVPTSTLPPPPVGGEGTRLSVLGSSVTGLVGLLAFVMWWL